MATAPPGMPAPLQAALESPVADRRSWQSDLAPAFIGLFLLIAFFDQLAKQTLSIGGLGWSVLGAAVAGLLAFVLLYYVPAMWGVRTRQPLSVVATSTFGASGAPWVPGLVMAAAHVIWFALAIFTAADVALRGLVAGHLVDQKYLEPTRFAGVTVQNPLFLFLTFTWILSAALIGIWVMRLVAAVMKGYAAIAALALGACVLWALPGLAGFRPLSIDPVTAEPVTNGGMLAYVTMIQLIFGFFAPSGAAATDWGAYTNTPRDVRLGGLVGVAFAAPIVVALALLTVAGGLGRGQLSPVLEAQLAAQARLEEAYQSRASEAVLEAARREVRAIGAEDFTFRAVIQHGMGGYPACLLLLIFGLAMLGPTCYAPFLFGHRLVAIWPRVPRWAWSGLSALLAWPLVALGVPARADRLFDLLGATMAPVVGAMAADYLKCRGGWPGPRRGVNWAGVVAWALGLAVGLIPTIGSALAIPRWQRVQPASLLAFLVAFLAYSVLARVGLEPRAMESSVPSPEPVAEPAGDAVAAGPAGDLP